LVQHKDHPDWDLESFEKLNKLGKSQGGITHLWRVRSAPLPIDQAVVIETRLHKRPWEPLEKPWWIIKAEDSPQTRGIVIDDIVYLSVRLQHPDSGAIAYAVPPQQSMSSLPFEPISVEAI
jgi:hypothetical protein